MVVTAVVTLAVSLVGMVLNCVLVMTIKCSPSLKTPPNSHLLNICFNNLLLGLQAFLSLPALYLNGAAQHVPSTTRNSDVQSGVQLFLVMHCLLQYWGAFASIGYYRFKTIHQPSLSLRVRRLIVSRAITTNWVISLLLATTFSLTFARESAYLPCTLDPFRNSFYAARVPVPEKEGGRGGEGREGELGTNSDQNSEQVVVLSLVLAALLLGLLFILTFYCTMCRTLHLAAAPRIGKSRVSPWPRRPATSPWSSCPALPGPPLPSPCSEILADPGHLAPSFDGMETTTTTTTTTTEFGLGGRAYRSDGLGGPELFCVSGGSSSSTGSEGCEVHWDDNNRGVRMVHYQRYDEHGSVCTRDLLAYHPSALPGQKNRSTSDKQDIYANKRPLTSTLSTGSTTSTGKTSSTICPEFSDISLGADFARRLKLQNRSVLKKQSMWRERGSLSNAWKNSLVMLTAYLTCSLPLIVCQIPGSLDRVTAQRRVEVLLVCRLLFLVNCPVYPLWYLLVSVRVKKCLKRMCECLPVPRLHHRPQQC